jgi:hypothetical protein
MWQETQDLHQFQEERMRKITVLVCALFVSLVIIQPLFAGGPPAGISRIQVSARLKEYINEITVKINSTEDPEAKRAMLNEALESVIGAFDTLESSKLISRKNREEIASLKGELADKYNELNGLNGYQKVADDQINSFALYCLQDLEQARNYITMSLGLFLLILIIILILA